MRKISDNYGNLEDRTTKGDKKIIQGSIKYNILMNTACIFEDNDISMNINIIEKVIPSTYDELFKPVCYRTGIELHSPIGYHIELIPCGELFKQGYINASPTIIPSNGEEIIITIIKIDDSKDDIDMGISYFQLIVRKSEYISWEQIESNTTNKQEIKYSDHSIVPDKKYKAKSTVVDFGLS